ncbi:MAG: hypothetical protein V4505_04795 [Pseudomonadota bacterium]
MLCCPASPHRRLWLAAWTVLGAGLLAALAILLGTVGDGPDRDPSMAYQVIDGKVFAVPLDERSPEVRAVELIGGEGGVFIYRFDRWLTSIWHGRRLAATVVVLAAAVALLCFHIAALMREGEGKNGDDGGSGSHPGGRGGSGGGARQRRMLLAGPAWRAGHRRHRRARRRVHAAVHTRPPQLR